MFKKPAGAANAATEPFRAPSLDEVSPEYAALHERRLDLDEKKRSLDLERSEIMFALDNEPPKPEPTSRVAALLGDEITGVPTSGKRARLTEIGREIADVDAALRILDERISAARGGASKTLCDQVRPMIKDRLETFVAHLAAAVSAAREVERAYDELDRSGAAWVGRIAPMRAAWLAETRGPQFAQQAFAAGLIAEVPEALK
ncbi:hypothetical protein ACFSCV_01755 [Methylopila henanensis]|uniref:Uncharacterized protein n=1 Tax=Methylopila henanensis TaxID=873516 RepID=A0ABW4K2R9_9HYPH